VNCFPTTVSYLNQQPANLAGCQKEGDDCGLRAVLLAQKIAALASGVYGYDGHKGKQ
jgi:hypothetical protein